MIKKLLLISLCISNIFALSTQTQEGEDIYLEANCQKCHSYGKKFYTTKNNVFNKSELQKWVTSCAVHFDISWFPEEKNSVVKYLNEIQYKYPKK
jgi:DUF2075 family protein